MAIIIGSARGNEYGGATGGKAGDQKQKSVPDWNGEVGFENFYVHPKGWYVLRPKDPNVANKIAERMSAACNNARIGYCQTHRTDVITYGINTTRDIECDCSSLVRACVKEATGIDPGNFNTAGQVAVLARTGLFEQYFGYNSKSVLYTGDILVTKVQGHTAIVTNGTDRNATTPTVASTVNSSAKVESAKFFSKDLSGVWTTTDYLHLRIGAGKNKTSLKIMPVGTQVRCYGYYSIYEGKKWLLVVTGGLTGFCSSEYLRR